MCSDWSLKTNKKAFYADGYKNLPRKYCTPVLTELSFSQKEWVPLNLFSSRALKFTSAGNHSFSEPVHLILVTKILVKHLLFSRPCWEKCFQLWAPPPYKKDTSGQVGLGLELCEERLREGPCSVWGGDRFGHPPATCWCLQAGYGENRARSFMLVHGRRIRDSGVKLRQELRLDKALTNLVWAHGWPCMQQEFGPEPSCSPFPPRLSCDPECPLWQLMVIQTQCRSIL